MYSGGGRAKREGTAPGCLSCSDVAVKKAVGGPRTVSGLDIRQKRMLWCLLPPQTGFLSRKQNKGRVVRRQGPPSAQCAPDGSWRGAAEAQRMRVESSTPGACESAVVVTVLRLRKLVGHSLRSWPSSTPRSPLLHLSSSFPIPRPFFLFDTPIVFSTFAARWVSCALRPQAFLSPSSRPSF